MTAASNTDKSIRSTEKSNRMLLPQTVRPKHYKLFFEPELEFPSQPSTNSEGQSGKKDLQFQGSVDIALEVNSPVDTVTLHALELDLKEAWLTVNANKKVTVKNISYDEEQQTATLHLTEPLKSGNDVSLHIDFVGTLNDKMAGFYRSSYKSSSNGDTRYMATTQFEPTDARRAFPCWDEPAIKANFEITLTVPPDRDCLSNMNAVSEHINEKGKKVVRFEKTPIMSTYLVAFIVGEFDYIEDTTKEGIRVRVYTLRGSSHLGQFALQVAVKTLSFFAEFFDIAYPLPKMDLIAIPDFAAGAMENWGCVTFREVALLIDPSNSTTLSRARVAEVVAHELAHQWFGNLVTMEWWTHLWLNEGFATWAADLAVDQMFPSWGTWMQFVSSTFAAALRLDSLQSSHPIEVEVAKAGDVNEIFDAISYCKGASVIRMLANYLSLESFQKGLQVYLKRFSYKNAGTDDLWNTLQEISGKPVFSLMSVWTRQTGYPVIELKPSENNKFYLSQQRFLSSGAMEQDTDSVWFVPISYISCSNSTQVKSYLLKKKEEELPDVQGRNEKWLKLNVNQSGVYRVNYPSSMWEAFRKPIEECQITSTDRLGLSMDSFALCRAGLLPTSASLQVMSSFYKEKDYTCWVDLIANFESLHSVFSCGDVQLQKMLEAFFSHILKRISQSLGWTPQKDEDHLTSLLRPKVQRAMVDYKNEEALSTAKHLFEQMLKSPNAVVADLRSVVMAAAISQGGREEFEQVKSIFESATLNEEKVRCLQVMGMTPDTTIVKDALEWGWNHVRYQDFIYLVSSVATNPKCSLLIWEYLKEKWSHLYERYGKGNFMLTNFVSVCTRSLNTEDQAKEVEAFFKDKSVEGCERTIRQSIERIRISAAWFKRDERELKVWLQQYLQRHQLSIGGQ
eukprot:jgi/Galph1/3302/GphlegSOOS_G1969.1